MGKLSKVIVTIVAIFLFMLLFGVLVGVRGDSGHSTPGFLGLILFGAVIGAVRAIWKKDDKKDNKDDDSILQK